jgi:hypothetical protein
VPPWTQQLTVAWQRPSVSFVPLHGAVLQELDRADLVRRFHVGPERVGIKLADGLHHLIFSPEYLVLASLTPKINHEVLRLGAESVWKQLEPTLVRRAEMDCRFVGAMDGSYDDVRRGLGNRQGRWPEGIENVDWAMSFDLAWDELEAEMHVEYGIVESSEAAQRLAYNQAAVVEDAEVHPSVFPLKSLPEVALFNSQHWRLSQLGFSSVDELFDLWSRAIGKAEEINMSISKGLSGDKNEHRNGS